MREGCLWTFGKRMGGEEIAAITPHTPQPLPRPGLGVSYTQGIWILKILITNLEQFPAKIPKHAFSLWLVLSVRK